MKLITKSVIRGCEERGDGGVAYLTRYSLPKTRWGTLSLHNFHRSDHDDDHDHPWAFWSVVLWPGYWEVTPLGSFRRWPLIPAYRPATWRHRVQLLSRTCESCLGTGDFFEIDCVRCAGRGILERPCWTLIWKGTRVREWGFFTKSGWTDFRTYFRENGC